MKAKAGNTLRGVLRLYKVPPKGRIGAVVRDFYMVPGWGTRFTYEEVWEAPRIWKELTPEDLPRVAITDLDALGRTTFSKTYTVEALVIGAAKHFLAGQPRNIERPYDWDEIDIPDPW